MAGLGSALPLLGNTLDASSGRLAAEALDDIGITAVPSVIRAIPVTSSGGIGVTPVLRESYGQAMLDVFRLSLSQITNQQSGVLVVDGPQIGDAVAAGLPTILVDTIGVAQTQIILNAVAVIEQLGLTPTLIPQARYQRSLSEEVSWVDQLVRFFGAYLVDTVATASTVASNALLNAVTQEIVGVAQVAIPTLVLRAVTNEGVTIEADEALRLVFSPTLVEGIELSAAYIAPDGSLTAWAMNTRTAGVTEYDNFEFNSFGVLAGRSIGATSGGLYELTGDDDAGSAIVARIKSGFMQFGGTKLSSLKAAYLATRGAAGFVLRIETGQGELYNYAVSTRDMRSTKVHMGKGLRARYFSFELISTGGDFDIDTLEFVPIVMQRRV